MLKCGEWSVYTTVPQEDWDVFEVAMKSLRGVDYEAIAVAKQVVSGINYVFICKATPLVLDPEPFFAKVKIYWPANGDPFVQEIVRI